MDYKDRYNRLLDAINELQEANPSDEGIQNWVKDNVPELKLSEDERIREALIRFHKSTIDIDGIKGEDIIAWLEKQGEQKSDDNVETKFKAGDWVVFANGNVGRITSAGTHGYTFDDGDYLLHENCDKQAHLWTIADAREGDVLCCESDWTCIFKTLVNDETFSSYCFMDKTKWFCETGSECHTLNKEFTKAYSGKIKPATKEQRDLLFQKMKEAGYEWDADKKELIKIEEKSENYKQQVMSEMTDLAEDYIKQKPTNSCNSIDCTPMARY